MISTGPAAPPGAAARGADVIHRAFDDFHARFRTATRRTQERFERRDWEGIRRDSVLRLGLHGQCIRETFETLRRELREDLEQRATWEAMKEAYSYAILGRDDCELAQTFFNSLTRKVFPHVGVDLAIDYASTDFPLPYKGWELASARVYAVPRVDRPVLRKILLEAGLRAPFAHLEEDLELAAAQLERRVAAALPGGRIDAIDVIRPVFIRNKGAYVVGRIRRGDRLLPLIFALLHEERGLEVDAVLDTEEQASILFSFARWYFHADLESPREVIGFLHSILPRKRVSELYISLGYNKHGKTEFFSDLVQHIAASDERFVVAPGQPGLVMAVFTLPSYSFVFKVIRDCFPPVKKMTRQDVERKYREVLQHDRVGRLVDFQEFEHLKFPRRRFSEELLDELLESCGRTVAVDGDDVVLRHLYVGRRVTPLDLFVGEAAEGAARAAVTDWGYAIKDLAAADIFPGDMLMKNFGVTRHGRVVFYDYDEICPLVDCNFRPLPPARDAWDDLAPEPWFSLEEGDVFPEEMATFLKLREPFWQAFLEHHRDLFEVAFWRTLQRRNRQGEVIDFFPYTQPQRLRPRQEAS